MCLDEIKTRIGQEGGMDRIFMTMQQLPDDKEVQYLAIQALTDLALGNGR